MEPEKTESSDTRGIIGVLTDINLLASKTEVKIDNLNERLVNHMYEEERNKDAVLSGFPGKNPSDHIYIHDKLDSFLRWQIAINAVLSISVIILAIAVVILFMV